MLKISVIEREREARKDKDVIHSILWSFVRKLIPLKGQGMISNELYLDTVKSMIAFEQEVGSTEYYRHHS